MNAYNLYILIVNQKVSFQLKDKLLSIIGQLNNSSINLPIISFIKLEKTAKTNV